jgi:hypothetical protein
MREDLSVPKRNAISVAINEDMLLLIMVRLDIVGLTIVLKEVLILIIFQII